MGKKVKFLEKHLAYLRTAHSTSQLHKGDLLVVNKLSPFTKLKEK